MNYFNHKFYAYYFILPLCYFFSFSIAAIEYLVTIADIFSFFLLVYFLSIKGHFSSAKNCR